MISKFGGSAVGVDGFFIPTIIKRINELKKDSKVIAVFSAPLTTYKGKQRSLTDIALEVGQIAERGGNVGVEELRKPYLKILELIDKRFQDDCKRTIDSFLEKVRLSLGEVLQKREFANETRAKVLAYSGEILMSYVMNYVLRSSGIRSDVVSFDIWPIITDKNIESANFLASQSLQNRNNVEQLLEKNDVLTIGGFIGKTADGVETTYERGGSDRTAADLGILFSKKYDTKIDFEIESAAAQKLFHSLENDRRYSEFVLLSPFTKDDIEFTRLLFLDGDYIKRNERYILAFDPLASITYNRGVITLIGDEMWRVQQVASKASAKIGEAGLNILNMDAQEETSRIIIVIEDSGDDIEKAIRAVHAERSKIKFV